MSGLPRCGRAASACRRRRRTAACCAAASQHRLLQAGVAQLAHAVGHRALARQHDALGGAHLVGSRRDDDLDAAACGRVHAPPATPSAGCPCRSRRRRRSAHRAASYSDALGRRNRRRPTRGSSASAMRSARAKALNTVSHWWCALSPLQVVDVQRDAARGWRSPGRTRSVSWVSKPPIMPLLNGTFMCQARAAGEVDHHARQRLVERHVGVAVAAEALLVADRLGRPPGRA